jgi:DNA-binding IclR family transcriptional regulator
MNAERYLRTFDILNLLVKHPQGLRLTEIKEALQLPVSSVHNALQTMVSTEVAIVNQDLRYAVGPRTVALALRTAHALDVRSVARKPLQDLAKTIGDDVYLGLCLGSRVIYVDRVLGTQRVSLDIRLGEPLFLHSTATGKLFAAFDHKLAAQALAARRPRLTPHTLIDAVDLQTEFERIRRQGYALSREESSPGITGYALPVRNATGRVTAAVHVSVLSTRATAAHARRLLASTRVCAELIERQLGFLDDDGLRVHQPARRVNG